VSPLERVGFNHGRPPDENKKRVSLPSSKTSRLFLQHNRFVESTINQLVSKRMVKKQQMQWTSRGAHLLLQVRTQVLNEDWDKTFRKWYPNFLSAQTPIQQC
jgi:hypothetical protein